MGDVVTSAEQQARDLLEKYGLENAQSWSAGDLVELANIIADADAYRRNAGLPTWKCVCSGQGGSAYSAQCPIHDPSVDTANLNWRKWYDDHLVAQQKIGERLGW